jgi:hypothetical protein
MERVKDGLLLSDIVEQAGTTALCFPKGTKLELGKGVMHIRHCRVGKGPEDAGRLTALIQFRRPPASEGTLQEWGESLWALARTSDDGLVFVPVNNEDPTQVLGEQSRRVELAVVRLQASPSSSSPSSSLSSKQGLHIPALSRHSATADVAWHLLTDETRERFAARQKLRHILIAQPQLSINTAVWLLGQEHFERLVLDPKKQLGFLSPGVDGVVVCGSAAVPEKPNDKRCLVLALRANTNVANDGHGNGVGVSTRQDYVRLKLNYQRDLLAMESVESREMLSNEINIDEKNVDSEKRRSVRSVEECVLHSPFTDFSAFAKKCNPVDVFLAIPAGLKTTPVSTDVSWKLLTHARIQGHDKLCKGIWGMLLPHPAVLFAGAVFQRFQLSTGQEFMDKLRKRLPAVNHYQRYLSEWKKSSAFCALVHAYREGALQAETSMATLALCSFRGFVRNKIMTKKDMDAYTRDNRLRALLKTESLEVKTDLPVS